MSASVGLLWRYPIKGIGCEPLTSVTLTADRPFPGDRAWAVLRDGQTDTGEWQRCATFLRGASGPSLMAIMATTTQQGIDLRHPDKATLSFDPETEASKLLDWLGGIWPDDKSAPAGLVKSPPQGMSDVDYPSVSILSLASLAALGQAAGRTLDPRRFRGNLWLDGLAPWEEFEWIGRKIAVGSAVLEIVERNERCRATEANPDTGHRDTDVLGILEERWGHTDFGIYARVIQGGEVSLGDSAVLI
ncbi:MAG: MOSC domain-containing protein [Pseudomonadota bacterium]